ncbi:class I SAM-dependent methyltransferase [Comamonas guangdongensis]|uniref:Class I SAM-dependent methyltransferase n=1 Tax=Comamonas guangdongensis TaxID=510515 RepID=A0ABV3ZXZ3_9BURK
MRLGNHRTKNLSLGAMLLHEIIRAPREIGAILPSSARLGDVMASLIDDGEQGLVVELGAGTGVITESLLRSGIAPSRLIVIEKSEPFACYLSERFPDICVVHADAGDFPAVLGQTAVKAVVSCLPLRSLPGSAVAKITATWVRSLASDGRIIQFTYAPFGASAWQDAGLKRIGCETVWANFPPARVEVFSSP